MPKIVILPHQDLCPDGAVLEANSGETILDAALRNGIEIEHACDKSCACTTCHCIVREGFDSLPERSEQEDDMLDKAWGLAPESRFNDEDDDIDFRQLSRHTWTVRALASIEDFNEAPAMVSSFASTCCGGGKNSGLISCSAATVHHTVSKTANVPMLKVT